MAARKRARKTARKAARKTTRKTTRKTARKAAGQSALDTLVDNCLHDLTFRKLLARNPRAALEKLNIYSPYREQVVKQQLVGAFPALQAVGSAFGGPRQFN
jgi:hypothetical protein